MQNESSPETGKQSFTLSTGVTMDLPVEYLDWTCIYAGFPLSLGSARDLLPSGKLHPILVLPGMTLLQIGAFEYREIRGVAPYNELSISIPVQYEPVANYPGMPIIHFPFFAPEKYSRLGVYVHRLPVTTQEGYTFGVDIWGFPKSVTEISFEETAKHRRCTLRSSGRDSVMLEVRKMSTRHRKIGYHCYTVKDRKLVRTPVQTEGDYGISRIPGGARYELGSGPLADELRYLEMGSVALHRVYAPRLKSSLHAASEYLDL